MSVLKHLPFLGVILVLQLWYLSFTLERPYYHAWDMDLSTAIDSLAIHQGLQPAHIHHTGFGMYWMGSLLSRIGHALGEISIINLSHLKDSLNPISAMAEYTDFLRTMTPFLALSVVLVFWTAVTLLFELNWAMSLLVLLLFGTLQGMTVGSSLVRTETPAFFFFGLSILTMVGLCRMESKRARFSLFIVLGALLGLSFMTKFQIVLLLLWVPFLLSLFMEKTGVSKDHCLEVILPERRLRLGLGISATLLALFILLTYLASQLELPTDLGTFENEYRPNLFFKVMLIALVSFTMYFGLRLIGKFNGRADHFVLGFTFLSLGFFSAFLLHFTLYASPGAGWTYLLSDFKMLFVRESYALPKMPWWGLKYISGQISNAFSLRPGYFIFNLISLILLSGLYVFKRIEMSRKVLLNLLAIAAIGWFAIGRGTRHTHAQDIIFVEIGLSFITLLICLWIYQRGKEFWFRWISVGLLTGLLVYQFSRTPTYAHHIDQYMSFYAYKENWWFNRVYGGSQHRYQEQMERFYKNQKMKNWASRHARRHSELKRLFEFMFYPLKPDHRSIGILAEGFPLARGSLALRFADVPREYEGWSFVDSKAIGVRELLLRNDLKAVLFSKEKRSYEGECDPRDLTLLDDTVEAQEGDRDFEFYAIELVYSCRFKTPPDFIAIDYRIDSLAKEERFETRKPPRNSE